MARQDDRLIREAIRHNVGYRHLPRLLHDPVGPSGPTLIDFPPTPPPGLPGEPPLPPNPFTEPIQGYTFSLFVQPLAATRIVLATPRLGFPFQLRRITFTGDVAIGDAVSWRVLVAGDGDTTAVADPTGSDVLVPIGDPVGAEDSGIHAGVSLGPVSVEPWFLQRDPGYFIKLKIHNTAAGAKKLTAIFDLDELKVL